MERKITPEAHAAVLRKVALTALRDARDAQKKARATPTEACVRAAFHACVFAARAARNAAKALPKGEREELLLEGTHMATLGEALKNQLVRIAVTE
jgi:hypothetical protein